MMILLQIVFGLGIVAVAFNGYRIGEIPAGAGFRPTRDDDPIAFHSFLTLYLCSGLALLVWGIFALFGLAEPMPLS
jgi:hypothetical protein